jgi:predicted metalloprotease
MRSLLRPRLLVTVALVLAAAVGASQFFGSARADPASEQKPATASNLVLGSQDGTQPQTMEQFLTAVTTDVDAYWTKIFQDEGLPEPHVSYDWIPAGETAASACGDDDGTMGDSAAAYCPNDDTIYISEKFATEVYDGSLDQSLPGSSQGYGSTAGDMAVAYIIAHEYGHNIQQELGTFDQHSDLPTMAFELQADCYAGTWANSANQDGKLEDGDVQEALNAALAVGDFDTSNPGHHGTPEQREAAWNEGFEAGDPSACNMYLDPANLSS